MPYTVSQVLGSDPESLSAASTEAARSAERVDAQIANARTQFSALGADWTGTAADAAQKQGREMLADQGEYRDKLRDAAVPLREGGTKMAEYRRRLKMRVDAAEDWWDVADDGSVSPGFWLRQFAGLSDVNAVTVESRRIPIECDIKLLLAQFEAADKDTAYKLRKIGWDLA
ncbi:WXG100 family type VII secretion target [Mycobacterium sp. NPDC003449]